MAVQKLDTEPRLTSVASDVIEWARRVVACLNGGIDYDAGQDSSIAAAQLAATQARPTGELAGFMLTAAPPGWVIGNGSTIGNVGSGATRANVDTLALFTAWWSFSDAQLPILTSAGGASTRGASAAADWAALKRLTVFDVTGRFARYANGGAVVVGTKYAQAIQSHVHTIRDVPGLFGFGGSATGVGPASGAGFATDLSTQGTGAAGGAETVPINFGLLGCFKL